MNSARLSMDETPKRNITHIGDGAKKLKCKSITLLQAKFITNCTDRYHVAYACMLHYIELTRKNAWRITNAYHHDKIDFLHIAYGADVLIPSVVYASIAHPSPAHAIHVLHAHLPYVAVNSALDYFAV